MTHCDTIIVGAGIGGLTAADRLQRAGQRVLVLEATERPGGRVVRISRKNGDSAEAGAQGIHSNYTQMLGLIDRFGLTDDLLPAFGKIQFLDHQGNPRVSGGNRDLMKIVGVRGSLDLAYFRTKYFTFAKPFSQFELTKDIPEYDDVNAADALKWAGRNFTDFVLKPMTWSMANSTPDRISLYYVVNGLRLRMTTRIMGLRTGNATILEKLAATLPVQYGARVASILQTGGKVEGVQLEDGRTIRARHVILACTAGAAGDILPEAYGEAKRFLQGFTHTSMPLVFFFLDRPVQQESFAFMGHPFRDATFNTVVNHARKTPYLAPSGKGLLSAWPAFPQTVDLFKLSDAAIIETARLDIEGLLPGVSDWIEEAQVFRHQWGLARYEPGMHRKVLAFKRQAEGIDGISFAGTDYDSIHMESGVRSGQRAADRALRQA